MKQLVAGPASASATLLRALAGYYWLSIGEARAGLLVWSFTSRARRRLRCSSSGFTARVWSIGRDPTARRFAPRLAPSARVAGGGRRGPVPLHRARRKLQDACADPSFRLASWLTLKLRKPVKPAAVLRVVAAIFWLVRWIVLPMLLMPWISHVAARDGAGFIPGAARLRLDGTAPSHARCCCCAPCGCHSACSTGAR